jgi:hypothetical protein
MNMKNLSRLNLSGMSIIVFATALMAFLANPAWAAGPVGPGSVPGGVTVTDSDGGSGESWGRAGGRTIIYEDFALANFTLLTWQPLTVAMAFDGVINGAEVMSSPVLSGGDTIQWTGETTIHHAPSNTYPLVDTRFTLTVLEGIGGPPYETDILATGGFLTTVMLFEAKLATDCAGCYVPALDFFDAFETAPEDAGNAVTSFDSGFFYEAIVGMSIEEHDNNMQARFDWVDGALDYLTIEWDNRIPYISGVVDDNHYLLEWVKIDLAELLSRDFSNLATKDDIEDLFNDINQILSDYFGEISDEISEQQDLLICMWVGDAFGPYCPPIPGLPNLLGIQADIAALSAGIAAQNSFEVSAVKSPPASNSDPAYVVLTKLNGLPTDATITSVLAMTESPGDGIGSESVPFSTSAVSAGLQQLDLELPEELEGIKTILIVVEGDDGDGNTLNGSVLVSQWK